MRYKYNHEEIMKTLQLTGDER